MGAKGTLNFIDHQFLFTSFIKEMVRLYINGPLFTIFDIFLRFLHTYELLVNFHKVSFVYNDVANIY